MPDLYRSLTARPERLRELLGGSPHAHTVVIDEVQRAPELLTVIHAVMEKPAPPRFVLTGSSARKLRRGGIDLLAGRAIQRTLHPFMVAELPSFDLTLALNIGLLPLAVSALDRQEVLKAYTNLYLDVANSKITCVTSGKVVNIIEHSKSHSIFNRYLSF
jgi:predicted AAA+ superfamily ATPase